MKKKKTKRRERRGRGEEYVLKAKTEKISKRSKWSGVLSTTEIKRLKKRPWI